MRRIINTFKHGTPQVKGRLIATIFFGLVVIGAVTCAVVFSQILFFFAAIVAAFVSILLAQSFEIHEFEHINFESVDVEDALPEEIVPEETVSEEIVPEEIISEETVVDKRLRTRRQKVKNTKSDKKNKKEKNSKEKKKKFKDNQEAIENDEVPEEEERDEEERIVPATVEDFKTYNKRKLKKTLYKYKVKRDHRMVIVDHCDKLSIYQSPAYIWVSDNKLHLLLLEKEPRQIVLSLLGMTEITYLKKHPVNVNMDYAVFKVKSILTEMFSKYLPDNSHSTVVDDLTAYKNLYGIGPDIYFTNSSARNLFDLLGFDFYVEDKVTTSYKVNVFFKDTYKANILLRDNVINANEYADRISNILESMARSTISHNEFKATLNLMVRNKLITQEFALYYMEVRDKVSR